MNPNSPANRRRKVRDAIAAEFNAANPTEVRDALVASMVDLDPTETIEAARAAIVAEWEREYPEAAKAAIVASFFADPEAERLVVNAQLLDWVAENSTLLTAWDSAAVTPGYRAFNPARRGAVRGALLASSSSTHEQRRHPSAGFRTRAQIETAKRLDDARWSAYVASQGADCAECG